MKDTLRLMTLQNALAMAIVKKMFILSKLCEEKH